MIGLGDWESAAVREPRDRRTASAIGRRARLDLVFSYRRGRTVLTFAYAEPPWRIGGSFDSGAYAYVILVCCGPGVFGGDELEQHVQVEPGARVLLTSHAALQVHPGLRSGPAELRSRYEVATDGELECFWDPMIPFAGASLAQRVDVQIGAGGGLFWSDGFMSGRTGRGEAWRFDELRHELTLRIDGSLKYLERFSLTPQVRGVRRTWMAGRAHYFGTTLVHGPLATPACAEELNCRFGALEDVRAGVDCIDRHLLVSRLLAVRGPQFRSARAAIREAFGRPPLRRN